VYAISSRTVPRFKPAKKLVYMFQSLEPMSSPSNSFQVLTMRQKTNIEAAGVDYREFLRSTATAATHRVLLGVTSRCSLRV
jgi:hypothetical protein